VRNFLALARQGAPERQQTSLNGVVAEVLEMMGHGLRVDDVEVSLGLAPDLPPLWADPHQLHQVLVNLVSNAHHALRGVPAPRRLAIETAHDAARGRVVLTVTDSGPGIPPGVLERLFEPFFTTKPQGRGTGLGLALCRGLVESHGGAIVAENTPDRGARFVLELPVGERRVARAAAPAAEPPPLRGCRILVVDDEPEIAWLLADILAVDGHRVDVAANGAVALERLAGGACDMVVTDLRMPVLDGPGLDREIERQHPGMARRVAVLTGDTLGAETRAFLERARLPALAKPFAVAEVRAVLRQVLEERSHEDPGRRR
jgi:two-component system NtrC family sensor kinase